MEHSAQHLTRDSASRSTAEVFQSLPPVASALSLPPGVSIEVFSRDHLPDNQTVCGIRELFHATYEDRYPFEALQDPKHYRRKLGSGSYISFVFRDAAGTVIGHAGIHSIGNKQFELGNHVVASSARGMGIGKAIRDASILLCEQLHARGQLDTIVVEGVTTHPITQKNFAAVDFTPTMLFDRKYADFFNQGYRESVLRMTKILNEEIQKARTVYIPASYAEIARLIYQESDCVRTIENTRAEAVSEHANETPEIDLSEFADFRNVTVTSVKGMHPLKLASESEGFFRVRAKHVTVKIDLTYPVAIDQIAVLRAKGFYLAGIEMLEFKDCLVLQRPIDAGAYKKLFPHVKTLEPDSSRKLMAMIRQRDLPH